MMQLFSTNSKEINFKVSHTHSLGMSLDLLHFFGSFCLKYLNNSVVRHSLVSLMYVVFLNSLIVKHPMDVPADVFQDADEDGPPPGPPVQV